MNSAQCTDLHFSSDSSPNARSSQAIEGSFTEFVSEDTVNQPKGRLESSTEFVSEDNSISSKQSCLILEIFAGSCRLSKACKQVGFRVTAVDKVEDRAENFPIYQGDVRNSGERTLLLQYIEAEKEELLHIHFAPSCGTASRAREKAPGPPPLRSDVHPDGLPNLKDSDRQRVEAANESYRAMITIAMFAISLGISISVENPKNSLFCKCSFVVLFLEWLPQYHVCEFQHCMHGGRRNKFTHWMSCNPRNLTVDMFQSLRLLCDQQHQHASWAPYIDEHGRQVFPTASEAAYPELLCTRVACILKAEALKAGFSFPTTLVDQLEAEPHAAKRQIFTTQPRGKRLRPLVSEFQAYKSILFPLNAERAIQQFLKTLPKGSRICHRTLTEGFFFWDDNLAKEAELVAHHSWEDGQPGEILHFGIPKEPHDFIADATAKGHPRDIIAKVPPTVKVLLKELACGEMSRRFAKRASFMKRWLKRSLELKDKELELHQQLPTHLQKILHGKRLLLFKEILTDLNYSDVAVVDDIVSGFQLTGWAPKTGVFDEDVRRPQLTLDQLKKMAPGINASIQRAVDDTQVDQTTEHVWKETWLEVEKRKGVVKPCHNIHGLFCCQTFWITARFKDTDDR